MIILQHAETDSFFCLISIGAKHVAFVYQFLSVYAMYNIAILAPPPCPDDPLLLGCQEMISQVRGAWKDGFRYKYVSAEMKKKITDSRLSHSTHHKPLQLQGFLSPLPLSVKQYGVCNRGHTLLWSPPYGGSRLRHHSRGGQWGWK